MQRVGTGQHFGLRPAERLQPLAVEIGSRRIGPEVAEHRAVGIHVGNDRKGRHVLQFASTPRLLVEQPLPEVPRRTIRPSFHRMWRAMIHTDCAPSPTTNRSRSRPCKLPPCSLAPAAACHEVCQQRKVPFP